MPNHLTRSIHRISIFVLLIIFLTSCNFPILESTPPAGLQDTSEGDNSQAQVTFYVKLPLPLNAGDSIYLTLLDEVTGLAFNSHKYIMQAEDALNYSVTLPFTQGQVLKYRYTRQGSVTVEEHLYNDRPVRYRLLDIEGTTTIHDVISRWTDTELSGPTGRIMGNVLDHSTGKPVPDLLVTAGGEQAFTMADGSFLLEGLPPGTHNLVFYALDGSYHIYQQGAVVAAYSTTPVALEIRPAALVTVIFNVSVPKDTPPDAPLRLAGNITQLGNTFADLSGGVNTLASRMPIMGKLPDGRYILTLNLYAGTYLEYKYSLGDGIWSSELTSNGNFNLRRLLIPDTDLVRNDSVETWQAPNTNPVTFNVRVPATTPSNEHVSIQFNPGFGWLEAMPMQSIIGTQGSTQWMFILTGPFNTLSNLQYRYCRQEQCGAADDSVTMGPSASGRMVNPSSNPGTIKDIITSWAWISDLNQAATVPNIQVTSRGEGFTAGLAFQSNYHPSYSSLVGDNIIHVPELGVNWLYLSPTWTFTNNTPPILESLPSQDMPLPELLGAISTAQKAGLHTGLFPEPNLPITAAEWWQEAARDFPWWVSFYERYSNFILHYATVASGTNSEALVMGGDWLAPALPKGTLSDGSESNVPGDAEQRWRELIGKVRDKYHGKLAWALSYPSGITNPPPFLDAFDEVYILWSAPLASQSNTPLDQLQAQAAAILDQQILPFQQLVGKPVILVLGYPSIDQSYNGCIPITNDQCFDYALLSQPNPDVAALPLNLQAQEDAYNAVLATINDRTWINGYISMGYYPPAFLQDKSTSIHGKPASGVMLFWSQKYLGR